MNRNDYLFHPPRFADPSVLRPLTAPLAFARTVERFPNRLAVVDGPTRLTWAELAERVRAFAAALQALGIAQGDVVALHLPNSWEFVVAHLAVSQIGAVSLPQHVPYREAELRTYLGHTEAKAIVGYAEAAQRMLSLLGDLPHLQTVVVTRPALCRTPRDVCRSVPAAGRPRSERSVCALLHLGDRIAACEGVHRHPRRLLIEFA